MKKVALVAFNGDAMCFVHVLLNALDMADAGFDVKVVIEGSATKLVKELVDPAKPFAGLYKKVKDRGLIDCVCKACSVKMDSIHAAQEQGLPLCDDISGHPSLRKYMDQGFEIITF
ncbi:MAG: DsrE family protein [Candidatus Zhuqueibacterota bacterium]